MLEPGLEDAVREFFSEQHSGHDIEIRNGEIVVVSPHDFVSANVVINLGAILRAWVLARKLGYVADSNGGFRYPDGDMMAPDVSFVSRARLPVVPRSFADAVPELVVEVQSSTQRASAVRAKLALLLEKGSTAGLFVNPDTHTVEIHRLGCATEYYGDGETFELADVLPGLRIEVASLWPD